MLGGQSRAVDRKIVATEKLERRKSECLPFYGSIFLSFIFVPVTGRQLRSSIERRVDRCRCSLNDSIDLCPVSFVCPRFVCPSAFLSLIAPRHWCAISED